MVLHFEEIPLNLKHKMVEKIGIEDLMEFEISSKHSNQVANSITRKPVLNVKKIKCSGESFYFYFESLRSKKKIEKKWEEMRNLQLPRFAVKKVILSSGITPDPLIKLGEEAQFTNFKTTLIWDKQGEHAVQIFKKLIQIFNVNAYQLDQFYDFSADSDPELLWLPEFHNLESIFYPEDPMPDEILLILRAHSINIGTLDSHPQVYQTLNKFFKQWLNKERQIKSFSVQDNQDIEKNMGNMLADIPYSLVWSNEHHENSPISQFSKEDIYEWCLDETIYMVDRGDKKLMVTISGEAIGAMEADDPKAYLKQALIEYSDSE